MNFSNSESASGICPNCRELMRVVMKTDKNNMPYFYPECIKCGHKGNLIPKRGKQK